MKSEQRLTRGTLSLTRLATNAMVLIAPGIFLWLTFKIQSLCGVPMAGSGMLFGILYALFLCVASVASY
jgi:basic amino acid/polyamine antiporter, APA family